MNGLFAPGTPPPPRGPQEQPPAGHVTKHHLRHSGLTSPNGIEVQVTLPEEIRPKDEPESEPETGRRKRR